MLPFLSLSPSLSSLSRPLPPPDLPLCSPCSLLQFNLNPDPDLDLDLDLVIDAPELAVPLDLFLPLLREDLDLDPDLVLVSQEDAPVPLLSLLFRPLLS